MIITLEENGIMVYQELVYFLFLLYLHIREIIIFFKIIIIYCQNPMYELLDTYALRINIIIYKKYSLITIQKQITRSI